MHRHKLRAEHEVNTYGRELLLDRLMPNDRKVIPFPCMTFIDGFGAYVTS